MKNVMLEGLYHKDPLDPEELFDICMEYREIIRPYLTDVSLYCTEELKKGKTILLEGQLGSMKDPDNGVRAMAAWAAGRIRFRLGIEDDEMLALLNSLLNDRSNLVQKSAEFALNDED